MYAHGAMALLFGGIGLLALWLRRQPPKLWRMRLLILLGGAGIIGFGVAIACIDQRITSNITPLLLACFACAMFILIRPAYAVPFWPGHAGLPTGDGPTPRPTRNCACRTRPTASPRSASACCCR